MYTICSNLDIRSRVSNTWPPTAQRLHRRGRHPSGVTQNPVVLVRVKPPKQSR